MWLESHGNLARHPKTRRLMRLMGWSLPCTIGNLHLLWYWALDFAPTGDLAHFEPEQLTCDLDLNGATPEQFIDAMIHAGFIDRIGSGPAESRPGGTMVEAGFLDREESGTLLLHDWPDYTAKSLRPRFRRDPERWHQILRSYNRPIPVRRPRKATSQSLPAPQSHSARAAHDLHLVVPPWRDAPEHSASTCAEREPEMAGSALRADPYLIHTDSATQSVQQPEPDSTTHNASANTVSSTPENSSPANTALPKPPGSPVQSGHDSTLAVPPRQEAPVPKSLSGRRNFTDWWLKLQECYQNKGCPLTAYEQSEILAMLARNPFTAVEKLQYSVVNFETSFAALPALGRKRPANTS